MDLGSVLMVSGMTLLVVAILARPLAERRSSLVTPEEHQLSALQAERDRILATIREIEMDHAMGKIRAEDFQSQRAALVARGARVLRAFDAQGGEAMPLEAEADLDSAIEAAITARRRQPIGAIAGFCPRCGYGVAADDRFCRRCGAPTARAVQS